MPGESRVFTTHVDPVSPPWIHPVGREWWRRRVLPPGPQRLFHTSFIAIVGVPTSGTIDVPAARSKTRSHGPAVAGPSARPSSCCSGRGAAGRPRMSGPCRAPGLHRSGRSRTGAVVRRTGGTGCRYRALSGSGHAPWPRRQDGPRRHMAERWRRAPAALGYAGRGERPAPSPDTGLGRPQDTRARDSTASGRASGRFRSKPERG